MGTDSIKLRFPVCISTDTDGSLALCNIRIDNIIYCIPNVHEASLNSRFCCLRQSFLSLMFRIFIRTMTATAYKAVNGLHCSGTAVQSLAQYCSQIYTSSECVMLQAYFSLPHRIIDTQLLNEVLPSRSSTFFPPQITQQLLSFMHE